jgi:(p)ppGpp synthase/HD superfamily hydrolase
MTKTILDAMNFANAAHKGQYRKGGQPYFMHLASVAKRVSDYCDRGEFQQGDKDLIQVAYLHDYLEDVEFTHGTIEKLKIAGFHDSVITAVIAITKAQNESVEDYYARVADNPLARTVKIFDMIDNISDQPSDAAWKRYAWGLNFLLNGG